MGNKKLDDCAFCCDVTCIYLSIQIAMNSVLITGCNRGLGLGLVMSFLTLRNPIKHIFATVRDPSGAQELKDLASAHNNLRILQLDVTSFDTFPELVKQITVNVGGKGLNMLINNAGYAPKSTRLDFVKAEDLERTLLINAVAPVMLTKALKPLLKASASSSDPAWIVNLSSVLGSMQANKDGGLYPYRASKAALNACTKSLSIDLWKDHIHAVSVHPGWVKTDMGGKNAQLEIEDSCRQMVQLFTSLKPDQNGKFLQFDGTYLEW